MQVGCVVMNFDMLVECVDVCEQCVLYLCVEIWNWQVDQIELYVYDVCVVECGECVVVDYWIDDCDVVKVVWVVLQYVDEECIVGVEKVWLYQYCVCDVVCGEMCDVCVE